MLENDAKSKWCPMVKSVNFSFAQDGSIDGDPKEMVAVSGMPHNRLVIGKPRESHLLDGLNCIGSACMMFREIKQPGHTHGHGDTVTKTEETVIAVYCGLAGKP